MSSSAAECTRQMLEIVPKVMHSIRSEMRSHRETGLSVPQFRVLIYLDRHKGASLSEIADHVGVSLPAMSKMVNGLVVRNLMSRQADLKDRRRVVLAATNAGHTLMQTARDATHASFMKRFTALPSSERDIVTHALQTLGSMFDIKHQV
jgi:DNA-binding MarR family transcriptional regulator